MSKKTTTEPGTTAATPAKRTRATKPQYYSVTIGTNEPVIVVAKTQKAALAAIVRISVAGAADLIDAGKSGRAVIDATKPGAVAVPGIGGGTGTGGGTGASSSDR